MLRYLNNIQRVRVYLGYSIEECADVLGVKRGSITDWQTGRRIMPRSKIKRLGVHIANKLSSENLARDIGVKIDMDGSKLNVTAWAQCKKCRGWFQLRRSRDRLCADCRPVRNGDVRGHITRPRG